MPDFHPENPNDADTLTMKLGSSKVSGRMDDVEIAVLLCDVCDEEFDSIQTVDSGKKTLSRYRNCKKKAELSTAAIFRHLTKPNSRLYIRNTVSSHVPSQIFAIRKQVYEPETAANSIELKKGEYHDYHVYLCATRYTIQPGQQPCPCHRNRRSGQLPDPQDIFD